MKEKWLQFPLTKKPGPPAPAPAPTPAPTTGWHGHTPGWHSIVWWYPSFLFLPNLLLHPPPPKSPPGRSDPSCSLCSADSSLEVAGRHILSPSLGGVFLQTYMVWGASWPPGASMGQGQVLCRWKPKTFTSAFTYGVCPSNYGEKQTFSLHQFPFQRLSDKH